MRKLVLAVLVLASCPALFAANWYVSKAATGTGAGTSWTNAWVDFNNIAFGSVACGDTIWVAGGTPYSGSLNITKVCTTGNTLTIKRVLSTDAVPVAAAGWNASFDSQVVNNNGGVTCTGCKFVTLDGRKGDASLCVLSSGTCVSTDANAYGMKWAYTGSSVVAFADGTATIDTWVMSHIEVFGPACVGAGTCTGSTWGLNLNQGQDNNTTVDHSWFHRFAEVIRPFETTNLMVSHSFIGEDVFCQPSSTCAADHEDLIYAADPCDMNLDANVWYGSGNDGIFFDFAGCTMKFTNNIMIGWGGWAISLGKTGTCGPYTIVNNTFANNGRGSDGAGNEFTFGFLQDSGCTISASSVFTNNIAYNMAHGFTNAEATFNGGTTANGGSWSCGTGCFSYALASPIQNFTGFVNFTNAGTPYYNVIVQSDLHLSAAGKTLFQGKGTNLTGTLCTTLPQVCLDKDGNTRPTSGAWDLGAFNATQAAAPAASLSQSSVDCGNSQIGSLVACTAVTLTNTGTATLNISSIAVGGANAGDFSQVNTCGSTLGAGLNCTITPSFNPTAGGSRTATISVTDDATTSPQSIALSGNGGIPVAGLAPSSLTFGSLNVSSSSSPQTLTLSNTGTSALSITSISLTGANTGDFFQSNNCPIGSSLGTSSSCTITVTFTPLAVGARAASVSVVDGASGSPHASTLSGTGVQPLISGQMNPGARMSGRATIK